MTLVKKIQAHLNQMAPHKRVRKTARLLEELRDENKKLREHIRCLVLWGEGCAMRLPFDERSELNWRIVNEARDILKQ